MTRESDEADEADEADERIFEVGRGPGLAPSSSIDIGMCARDAVTQWTFMMGKPMSLVLARIVAAVVAAVAIAIVACVPVADGAGAGEGEGEGEPACANGRLIATAGTDVDVDTCLTTRTLSEDGRELLFWLDETFDLRITSNVELNPLPTAPFVLDDDNSSTIAGYDDGEHFWRISDGQIVGLAVGEGVTTIESVDDDGVHHGFFDGAAFDNDGDEVVDPMIVRVDF